MKQPLLTDTASSYFSAQNNQFENQSKSVEDGYRNLRFPQSKVDLWNTMPCGDAIEFGIQHYHPVTLLCLERCLRLAHRHASQSFCEEQLEKNQFHGFLMGSTSYSDDESGIIINLDRFDPGTVRTDGNKTPSTPLPGDVVVPVKFSRGLPHSADVFNIFSVNDYENTFKLLHHQVSSHLAVENTSLLPLRLYCYYDKDSSRDYDVQLQLHWVTPCIANSLRATPVKPVPIIPTALAKNLTGPLNLSQIQNSTKTGYLSMNQSRKLLLLLDSDPKSRSVPTVGLWVSGVISVHNPVVWLACMRYLYCDDIYERIMTDDGQFLLVLYSVTSRNPMFFQVKSDDNDKLNFDLLHTQKSVQVCKQSGGDSESVIEARLHSTSSSLPEVAFKEREIFLEALENSEPFLAPKKAVTQQQGEDGPFEVDPSPPRGRQPKKDNGPQSILRKNSNGRKSSGNRYKNNSNGVSFSLAVDNSCEMEATPMPLPSPHPSTIHQSPGLIKPTVPELSIIFDENYPIPGRQDVPRQRQQSRSPTKRRTMSEKVPANSPGIRSPLKTINNFNSVNRGPTPPDRRLGPMKPPNYRPPFKNGYGPNKPQVNGVQPYPGMPQNIPTPSMQRRSRSASDAFRGPVKGHVHPLHPMGPPTRPIMSYPAMYNSTPIAVANTHPNVPITTQGPPLTQHPYQNGFSYPHPAPSRPPVPYPYPSHSEVQYSPKYSSTTVPNCTQVGYPLPQPHISAHPMTTVTQQTPTTYYQNTPLSNPLVTPGTQAVENLPQHQERHLITPFSKPGPQPTPYPNTTQCPSSASTHETSHPLKTPGAENPLPPNPLSLPAESPAWMKQLPPEAYQLLMQQDAQLKQLQAQIQKLLSIQEKIPPLEQDAKMVEMSTSTESKTSKLSMGVNTGASLCFLNVEKRQSEKEIETETPALSTDTTPQSTPGTRPSILDTPGHFEQTPATSEGSEISSRVLIAAPNQLNSVRCESQCTEKYQCSEFASILLDDSNLREIASANNEDDCDVRSLASSLRAVDLPVLETSTEQSSVNTPTRKPGIDVWDAQDSPVLGESASMCIVPPINLNKSLSDVANEEEEEEMEDPKDEAFMKNLLSQVRDMLKKADIDGASEMSSENSAASTPQRRDGKTQRKTRQSHEDRVAKATRKQLRKMGVRLEGDVVNAMSSTVTSDVKKSKAPDAYPYTLPEPLIPRLNYMSIMAGTVGNNSIFPGPSSTDLSMHANAIALKYLSNDQLEEIAALSKLGKNTSLLFSPLKNKNEKSSQGSSETSTDFFLGTGGKKHLPGMSLVSPCNMSLATRKYMEKYGLIDAEEDTEEETEAERDGDGEREEPKDFLRQNRPHTPVLSGLNNPTSSSDSPVLKGIRQQPENVEESDVKIQDKMAKSKNTEAGGFTEFPGEEPGFSELKMNLGDTLDMILPFLDDLGRHRQQTPSSGTRSGTRSTRTSSSKDRLGSVSGRHSMESPSGERVYSPQALEALTRTREYLKQRNSGEHTSRPNSRHSDRGHPLQETSRNRSPSDGCQKNHSRRVTDEDQDVSQILSPKLLQALAEGKKLGLTPISSARTGYITNSYRPSNDDEDEFENEDVLAGTWPQHHFRSRSESGSRKEPGSTRGLHKPDCRRQSTSPQIPGGSSSSSRKSHHQEHRRHRTSPPSSSKLRRIRAIHERTSSNVLEDVKEVEWNSTDHGKTEDNEENKQDEEEEEPVLTSRVTDAFREKEETSRGVSEEKSGRESAPHFLQHLQTNSHLEGENEQFLDFEKIKNLPKLN